MGKRKSDVELGMGRSITRRDFVQGAGLAALGLMLPAGCGVDQDLPPGPTKQAPYPPTRVGMRGSHPGSFEVAHSLARAGLPIGDAADLDEEYDLVVVGAGISGLTAAYEYRKTFGSQARILILENHDDFGGHAKRNEFHQGGRMRLSWGGTMNLEYLSFSEPVLGFLSELGVDLAGLSEIDFHYGGDLPAIWFDAETFGQDVLVPGFSMYERKPDAIESIDKFPISAEGREALKAFYRLEDNLLEDFSDADVHRVLHQTSYTDFLSDHAGLPEDAVHLFVKATDGYWGVQPHSLSTAEAMNAWLPGAHRLGSAADRAAGLEESEKVAMFPDGNASIARLLVRALIPASAPGSLPEQIAQAVFDYGQLDRSGSATRIRLESTVVNAANVGGGVVVTYARAGRVLRVKSRHCVMACYHAIIPHLCPEMPETQKEAQRYQVKHPMLLTNVLVRNGDALDKLGISGAYCPGRMHAKVFTTRGVNTAGYDPEADASTAVPLMFWGMPAPPDASVSIHEQLRGAREVLLTLTFEDFEREVRTVLDGMLGPAGFDSAEDILAITVNRWPHGYSYGYLDLWDSPHEAGRAPHELARKPFGNITIANSDAAAEAYTQAAIMEGLRAVEELRQD